MRIIIPVVLFVFLTFSISAQTQLEIPYYEPFENSSYENDWGVQQIYDPNDLRIFPMEFNQDFYGKSLHLKVLPGDNLYSNNNPNSSRSEVKMKNGKHIISNGDEYYYSWDLYIPSNGDFPDSEFAENWYNIMQWHPGSTESSYCNGAGLPPILLQYQNNESSTDNKRDLKLVYGTNYGGCNTDICDIFHPSLGAEGPDDNSRGKRTYYIKEAITKGEWNHIVTKIKWGYKGNESYIEMWINDFPVIDDPNTSNTYNDCNGIPNERIVGSNNQEMPAQFDSVPLLYTRSDSPSTPSQSDLLQVSQKLGHYRNNYSTTNILYIDNYRITTDYPPSPFRTHLIESDCGRIIGIDESYVVTAHKIEPSTSYKFRIQEVGSNSGPFYFNSSTNSMDIFQTSWAKAKTTYDIEVRVENSSNNNQGFAYGKVCQVTTPHKTKLKPEFCDNLSLTSTIIECYPVLGATNYKFKVTDLKTGVDVYWYNSSQNVMDLSQRSWFIYGRKYSIEVRVSTNDDEYAYWEPCEVKVPYVPRKINQDTESIRLYPNPTTNVISVQVTNSAKVETVNRLQLIDINGRLIKDVSNSDSIDLTDYKAGIYFLKIITDEFTTIKKVIKR